MSVLHRATTSLTPPQRPPPVGVIHQKDYCETLCGKWRVGVFSFAAQAVKLPTRASPVLNPARANSTDLVCCHWQLAPLPWTHQKASPTSSHTSYLPPLLVPSETKQIQDIFHHSPERCAQDRLILCSPPPVLTAVRHLTPVIVPLSGKPDLRPPFKANSLQLPGSYGCEDNALKSTLAFISRLVRLSTLDF